jgi:hypothetical protein
MVVSFKVSKIGTRYRPKPVRLSEEDDEPSPTEQDSKVSQPEVVIFGSKGSPLRCVYRESLYNFV